MSCRTSLYSGVHVDHIWGGPERYTLETQKFIFSVTFFILIFLKKNFGSSQNLKFRSPNFHFLRPYVIIFNIALPINFWMLIFLYKVLHPLMFDHFSGYRWAKNIMNLIDYFFYLKFFDFSDLGIFRPLTPLTRFV